MLFDRPELDDNSVVKIFATSDIMTLPTNISKIQVYCLGGGSGGGGGGAGSFNSVRLVGNGGGGGACGGYRYKTVDTLRGESLLITVGHGGKGGRGAKIPESKGDDGESGHGSKVVGTRSGSLVENKNNPEGGKGGGSGRFSSVREAKGENGSVYFSEERRKIRYGGRAGEVLFQAGSGGGGGTFPIRVDLPDIDYSGLPGNGGNGGAEHSPGGLGTDATLFGSGGGGGGGGSASTYKEGYWGGDGSVGALGFVVVIY